MSDTSSELSSSSPVVAEVVSTPRKKSKPNNEHILEKKTDKGTNDKKKGKTNQELGVKDKKKRKSHNKKGKKNGKKSQLDDLTFVLIQDLLPGSKVEDNIYDGDINDKSRLPEGLGKLTFLNGDIYEGLWEGGTRSGFGNMMHATGERYQGSWENDLQNGEGLVLYPDGSIYNGTWENGKREGGHYEFMQNDEMWTLESEWHEDTPNGTGILENSEGRYEGEISYVIKDKHAIPLYRILREGYGDFYYKNGVRYTGFWKDDKRKSFGVLVEKKGNRYYGNWKKDRKSGYGIYMYTDGTYYEGKFTRDKRNGRGVLYLPNGDVVSGEWKDDNIARAVFYKGEYAEKPRHIKSLFLREINSPSMLEEREQFTSSNKWANFVDIGLEESSFEEGDIIELTEILEAINEKEDDQKMNSSRTDRIIDTMAKFIVVFNWEYSASMKLSYKEKLPHAVDDINSFIACLCEEVVNRLDLDYDSHKALYKAVFEHIFPKIYKTLLNIYDNTYRNSNLLMETKMNELENVDLQLIGIKPKFQITSKSKRDPYYPVIKQLIKLCKAKSPFQKLEALHQVSDAILLTVDSFYQDKSKQIVMGAEDKFPILIYCIIKSLVPNLASHHAMLSDFVNPLFGDIEADYRISEFENSISYVSNLDIKLMDDTGILTPLEAIVQNIVWTVQSTISEVRLDNIPFTEISDDISEADARGKFLLVISKILRDRDKKEESNLFNFTDPFDETITIVHIDTLNIIVETAGLAVTEGSKSGLEIEKIRNFPHYVYSKLAEAVIKNIGDIIYI